MTPEITILACLFVSFIGSLAAKEVHRIYVHYRIKREFIGFMRAMGQQFDHGEPGESNVVKVEFRKS